MYFIHGDRFIIFLGEIHDLTFGDVDVLVNIICRFCYPCTYMSDINVSGILFSLKKVVLGSAINTVQGFGMSLLWNFSKH